MDIRITYEGLFNIVEGVEEKRCKYYGSVGKLCKDIGVRQLCWQLIARSHERVHALALRNARDHTRAMQARPVRQESHTCASVHTMASLAFFAGNEDEARSNALKATRKLMLKDEVRRSQKAIVFYSGLRGFTRDQMTYTAIEACVNMEKIYIDKISLQLIAAMSDFSRKHACLDTQQPHVSRTVNRETLRSSLDNHEAVLR